jgi:hypothetical protein
VRPTAKTKAAVKADCSTLPARLRSAEDPAADLGEFGDQCAGISTGQGAGVYLGGQQDSGREVCAAGETTLVNPSWKLEELRNSATDATVTNPIPIGAF